MMIRLVIRFISVLAVLALAAGPVDSADVVIVNGDAPGEGLNDLTPVAPVGGNTGTTLGEQRLIACQAAANRWGGTLESAVEIRIEILFDPLECDETSAVLGATATLGFESNFLNAPLPGVLYHRALANAIAGFDLSPAGNDIRVFMNSNLDSDPICLGGVGWYYGLDGDPGLQEPLYPVLTHEYAHGLGFSNTVSEDTGQFWFGSPDIYSVFSYDETVGLHWDEMNVAQRMASAINTSSLVWDGAEAMAAAAETLFADSMEVEVPSTFDTYDALGAIFGRPPPLQFTGTVALVNDGTASPREGCSSLIGFVAGRIAYADRGGCEFSVKALNAQNAGASAVIVGNNTGRDEILRMAPGAVGDQIRIPAMSISQDAGKFLKAALPTSATAGVLRYFGRHATSHRPLLYAPLPVELGSSVSHWDASAAPDLLMEPFASADIFDELDMTPALFRDEGWTAQDPDPIFEDGFETGDTTMWDTTIP